MREIEFRGLTLNGQWVYGDLSRFSCAPKCAFIGTADNGTVQVIPSTVGQYTGLVDKNSRKIYEGDIITSGFTYDMEVFWMGVAWGVRWKDMGHDEDGIICDDGGDMSFGNENQLVHMEVVANIHENPERLKGR